MMWKLLAVCCWLAGAAAFDDYPNFDCYGGAFANFASPSVDNCKQKCLQEPRCHIITYIGSEHKKCHMKERGACQITKYSGGIQLHTAVKDGLNVHSVHFTADDKAWLYADGNYIDAQDNWQIAKQVTIQDTAQIIAVLARNDDAPSYAGILLSTDSGLHTNTSWRCAPVKDETDTAWTQTDFDDSGWSYAVGYGQLGVGPWAKPAGLGAVDPKAHWIWTNTKYHKFVGCRFQYVSSSIVKNSAFTDYHHHNCAGAHFAHAASPSFDECKSKCLKEPRCHSISYFETTKVCSMAERGSCRMVAMTHNKFNFINHSAVKN